MSELTALLTLLNSLDPLAIIALFGVVIYLLVKNQRKVDNHFETVRTNDLQHIDLPEVTESLRRIEVAIGSLDSFIRAKLNGGSNARSKD